MSGGSGRLEQGGLEHQPGEARFPRTCGLRTSRRSGNEDGKLQLVVRTRSEKRKRPLSNDPHWRRTGRWRVKPRRAVVLRDGRRATLRPLAREDAGPMADFFASLTESEVYYFFALEDHEARRLALEAHSASAFRLVAVVRADGREVIAAYAFLDRTPLISDDGAPEFGICLRPGLQSGGLGRLLMDHLLDAAAASGIVRVRLAVHPDNGRALRLYQRRGFRLVGEFVNDHQGAHQYRMEARLDLPAPETSGDPVIVPAGGPGIGLLAARLQDVLEAATGKRPLLSDRPSPVARTILLADLCTRSLPKGPPAPLPPPGSREVGWVTWLDARHLLVTGAGLPGVEAAVERFVETCRKRPSEAPFPTLP